MNLANPVHHPFFFLPRGQTRSGPPPPAARCHGVKGPVSHGHASVRLGFNSTPPPRRSEHGGAVEEREGGPSGAKPLGETTLVRFLWSSHRLPSTAGGRRSTAGGWRVTNGAVPCCRTAPAAQSAGGWAGASGKKRKRKGRARAALPFRGEGARGAALYLSSTPSRQERRRRGLRRRGGGHTEAVPARRALVRRVSPAAGSGTTVACVGGVLRAGDLPRATSPSRPPNVLSCRAVLLCLVCPHGGAGKHTTARWVRWEVRLGVLSAPGAGCGTFRMFLEIAPGEEAHRKPLRRVFPNACGWSPEAFG